MPYLSIFIKKAHYLKKSSIFVQLHSCKFKIETLRKNIIGKITLYY